jgi:2-polyprenyl-3-methyl-5-hydroxy-6-metoxy-1,4-benzoquinol methylase
VRVHAVAGPQDAGLNASIAYDAIAAGYDDQVRGDDWMRRVLHAHYARVFRPGQRVLDVGCGTGIDALALARMGVSVVGIDSSSAMVQRLSEKIGDARLAVLIEARVMRIQDLGALGEQRFDGVISAFASLSSLPDLAGFAQDAARLTRPGGRLILHLLNRFSFWEFLGCVARRDFAAALRVGHLERRVFVIGGQAVDHRLYFPDEVYRRFFAAAFRLRDSYSLGALRPPHTVRRLPQRLVSALEWLDVRAGRWPLVHHAGRFFVLDLERLSHI